MVRVRASGFAPRRPAARHAPAEPQMRGQVEAEDPGPVGVAAAGLFGAAEGQLGDGGASFARIAAVSGPRSIWPPRCSPGHVGPRPYNLRTARQPQGQPFEL